MTISFNVNVWNSIPFILTIIVVIIAYNFLQESDSSSSYSSFIPDVFTPTFNIVISLIALLVIAVIWILFLILKVNGII